MPELQLDTDLRSVQQAREMVLASHEAWQSYAHFSQEKVDRIVAACAEAASSAAYEIAKAAVDETGFGVVEHKFIKNKFAAEEVHASIRDMKTVGIIGESADRRVYEIAEPVGVIAAVVPSTNPTSTAIYKVLIALKSRNGVVLSPHPSAKNCIRDTAEVLKRAARAEGAPDGLLDCMTEVSLEGTRELMSHRRTAVILATGGMGLVRAAYSSGKPAFGVGPGNVPAYIESSADVAKAVRDIITGKTFDNGTLCCSEQALICDAAIEAQVREEVVRQGGHFLDAGQIETLSRVAVLPSRLANPEIVGKSARFIADKAGFAVPDGTRALVAELDGVGRDTPLSIEKLSPILAFYVVRDWHEGCARAKQILKYGGMGHTLSVHSRDDTVIREFALQKPASRIVANSPATHGAVGFSTGLAPAMTLGCGSYGGNITSDNITPLHLINVKRLAYELRGVDLDAALESYGYSGERTAPSSAPIGERTRPRPLQTQTQGIAPLEQRVSRFLEQRGVYGGGSSSDPSPSHEPGSSFEGDAPPSAPSREAPVPEVRAMEFIAEDDVRRALADGRKLPVGTGTLITPSAREVGNEHNIFLRV